MVSADSIPGLLSSPGYPDSKTKTIHNLPVNQDMGTKSWRYSKGDEK